jgi:hypothetical protein
MLVRIKTNSDTSVSDLRASLATIIGGSMTVSNSKPTNLTNMDQANCVIYGTTYTNSNSLYTVTDGSPYLEITKVHSEDASDNVKVSLASSANTLEPRIITPIGQTDDNFSYDPADGLMPLTGTSYIDVLISDKVLLIQGPAGVAEIDGGTNQYQYDATKVKCIFAIYEMKDNAATALTPDMCKFAIDLSGFTSSQITTQFGAHNEVLMPYVSIDAVYQASTDDEELNSFATDGLVVSGVQKFIMNRVYAGSFNSGLYEVHNVFAIGNNPSFPSTVVQDANNAYYYITGKLGAVGTGSISSASSPANLGCHILVEID